MKLIINNLLKRRLLFIIISINNYTIHTIFYIHYLHSFYYLQSSYSKIIYQQLVFIKNNK